MTVVGRHATLPCLGLGTYELRGDDCVRAVSDALRMGYRLIDTAAVYRNEELVGKGIVESGIPREEIFVVVKVAMKSMTSSEKAREGILASLQKLQLTYADCVLMHWPGCGGLKPDNAEGHRTARERVWAVMREVQREGKTRHIGVSNFLPRHFNDLHPLVTEAGGPLINQIELHPLCIQEDVVKYCRREGILLQQYSPLGSGNSRVMEHPRLLELQAQYFPDHSVAEVLVLWGFVQGFCTLVRSRQTSRLESYLRCAAEWKAYQDGSATAENDKDRVLRAEQVEVLRELRQRMGITADEHMCWFSDCIA